MSQWPHRPLHLSLTKGSMMTTAKNHRGLGPQDTERLSVNPAPRLVAVHDNDLRQELPAAAAISPHNGKADEADPLSPAVCGQVRKAYGLLQGAIEEAAENVECAGVKITAELLDLQARAVRSIQESALATIDLFEAIGAAKVGSEQINGNGSSARKTNGAGEHLADFFASARQMVTLMTEPLDMRLRVLSVAASADRGGSGQADDNVLERLNKLTARQKKVLELLAQGLPNKVIAHELGISETTVKAHVGEILRKLKVYNRARAIVMLAQFDLRQIQALHAADAGVA